MIRSGIHVVIGVGHEIVQNLDRLPPGIFFGKGLNVVQRNLLQNVSDHGHIPVVVDEECLGIADPWYMMRDVADDIAEHVHTIYCQGKVQRDALSELRFVPDEKLELTGNPRVDLMREPFLTLHDEYSETLRKQNGRFILINTNSGSVNNLWGDLSVYKNILAEIGWADPDNEDDQRLVEDHIEHDRNNVRAIEDFVRELTNRASDIPLVLRPHPSERPEPWTEFAKNFQNLTVVSDSELAPWLLASALVVTTGCTTAAEAIVMGKDAISLIAQPDHVRHPDFFLANVVAHKETNAARAAETAISVLRGDRRTIERDKASRRSALANHIDDGRDGPAFEKIGDHLTSLVRAYHDNSWNSERLDQVSLKNDLEVKKISWEKAYCSPQEMGERLSNLLKILRWELSGDLKSLGYGTYLLSPTRKA